MIIQKFLAFLLLIVFSIGIMPKVILHDVVADHIDARYDNYAKEHSEKISETVFSCDCNHLVAESPFADDLVFIDVSAFSQYAALDCPDYKPDLHYTFHSRDSRGPPEM